MIIRFHTLLKIKYYIYLTILKIVFNEWSRQRKMVLRLLFILKIIFQKKKKEKWSKKIYQNILKARLSIHNLILT